MTRTLMVCLVLGLSAPVAAQTPESSTSAPASLPTLGAPAAIPLGSRVGELPTTYEDGGRRDPFASLVAPRRSASSAMADGRPRRGLAALALADVAVRGVVRNGAVMMAILEGPNKQSFIARANDQLLDAEVASIDQAGVVFAEMTESGMTPNQVRKALRVAGEELR